MDHEQDYMVIEKEQFQSLVVTDDRYSALIHALFSSADLSYTNKTLTFDTYAIDIILKMLEPYRYGQVLENLIKEKDGNNE